VSDTLSNGGFYFERNNSINYNEKNFHEFRMRLGLTHTELHGFLATGENSLFLYYPELNEEFKLWSYNYPNNSCNSVTIKYNLILDSIYVRREKYRVCGNGYLLTGSDTIHKFIVQKFSLLIKEDNLGLYVNKNKGIVGWTSQLSDREIISYGGEIYQDTLNTILHRKKIIQ
jgi:hypothetical protein